MAGPSSRDKSNLSPELWETLVSRFPHFKPTGDALSDSLAAGLGPFPKERCLLFDASPRLPLTPEVVITHCGEAPFFNPRPSPPARGAEEGEVFLEQVVDLLPAVVSQALCSSAFLLQPLSSKSTSKPGLRATPDWILQLHRRGVLLRIDHLAAFIPPGMYLRDRASGRLQWRASAYGYQHWVLATLGNPTKVAQERLSHSLWRPTDAFLRPTRPFPDLLAIAARSPVQLYQHLMTEEERVTVLRPSVDAPDAGVNINLGARSAELFAWAPKSSGIEAMLRARGVAFTLFRTNGTRFEREFFVTIEGEEAELLAVYGAVLGAHREARCTWPDLLNPEWESRLGRSLVRFKVQRGRLQKLEESGQNPQQFIVESLKSVMGMDLQRRLSLAPNGYDLIAFLTPAELSRGVEAWRALDEEFGIMMFSKGDLRIKRPAAEDLERGSLSRVVCLQDVPCGLPPDAIHGALTRLGIQWDPNKFRVVRNSALRRMLWLTLESEGDKRRLLDAANLQCGAGISLVISDPYAQLPGSDRPFVPPELAATDSPLLAVPHSAMVAPSIQADDSRPPAPAGCPGPPPAPAYRSPTTPVGSVPGRFLSPLPPTRRESIAGSRASAAPSSPPSWGGAPLPNGGSPPSSGPYAEPLLVGTPGRRPRKRANSVRGYRSSSSVADMFRRESLLSLPGFRTPGSTPLSMDRKRSRVKDVLDVGPDTPASASSSLRTSEWDAADSSFAESPPPASGCGGGRSE